MPRAFPLTPTTLDRLLRSVSEHEFAEFVADLWEYRGWETSTQDTIVTATKEAPQSETRRIRVLPDERSRIARLLGRSGTVPDPTEYDVLVVGYRTDDLFKEAETDADVSLIDVEDLYYRLLYAVDRDTCRSLCRQHFGRAIDPVAPTGPEGGRYRPRLHRFVNQLRNTRWRAATAVVIGVVLVAAVLAYGTAGIGSDSSIAPGGGRVPADGHPATPVGIARTPLAASGASSTPTNARRSGATPAMATSDGPDPQPREPTSILDTQGFNRTVYAAVASSPLICHDDSKDAIRAFVWSIEKSDEIGQQTLRIARNVTVPQHRMSIEALTAVVTNGSLQELRDFDKRSFGRPPQFPPVDSNATTHRHHLSVFDKTDRSVYGFVVLRRNFTRESSIKSLLVEEGARSEKFGSGNQSGEFISATEECWLISDVILLDIFSSD